MLFQQLVFQPLELYLQPQMAILYYFTLFCARKAEFTKGITNIIQISLTAKQIKIVLL